jgi:3-ketosteroid 9alpha-monooxygenase subunit B
MRLSFCSVENEVLREHGFHLLRVKAVVDETADTRSLVLDVPDELREVFRYRSGQFCTFRVRIGGDELMRCYSMSSAPETGGDLTVTVKRVPGGAVSNWLNDHAQVGAVLETTRPAGVFCVRDHDAPVVGFCGGSGVTPVISIVKSVLATTERPVALLYANRDPESVIFDAPLRALELRHPERLQVHRHFDSESGLVSPAAIADISAVHPDADFYICGPGPFMDLVETTLLGLDVASDRILIERFAIGDLDTSTRAAIAESDGGEVTETVTLILKGVTKTVAYQAGDTILSTARRGAMQPPFSCEAGNCATCMAIVRRGSATMRANNALRPDEVEDGWVLTCQALPIGRHVTVEYEEF